jgi:predicted Zn-dependent protease
VWWYNANAFDPNGEPVTYALANAPEGMTIDAQTGFVQWTPAGEATVTFTLIASDGRAETAAELSLAVRAP